MRFPIGGGFSWSPKGTPYLLLALFVFGLMYTYADAYFMPVFEGSQLVQASVSKHKISDAANAKCMAGNYNCRYGSQPSRGQQGPCMYAFDCSVTPVKGSKVKSICTAEKKCTELSFEDNKPLGTSIGEAEVELRKLQDERDRLKAERDLYQTCLDGSCEVTDQERYDTSNRALEQNTAKIRQNIQSQLDVLARDIVNVSDEGGSPRDLLERERALMELKASIPSSADAYSLTPTESEPRVPMSANIQPLSGQTFVDQPMEPDSGKENAPEKGLLAKLASMEPKDLVPKEMRELVYYSVEPFGYSARWNESILDTVGRTATQIEYGITNGTHIMDSDAAVQDFADLTRRGAQNRLDAWRVYLDLPQEYSTFSVSQFRPTVSVDPDKQYLSINNFLPSFVDFAQRNDAEIARQIERGTYTVLPGDQPFLNISSDADAIRYFVDTMNTKVQEGDVAPSGGVVFKDHANQVMNNYTMFLGEDQNGPYLSYYDRWDLKGSIEGKNGIIGRPFEIYDRIYYDPITHEPRQPWRK